MYPFRWRYLYALPLADLVFPLFLFLGQRSLRRKLDTAKQCEDNVKNP